MLYVCIYILVGKKKHAVQYTIIIKRDVKYLKVKLPEPTTNKRFPPETKKKWKEKKLEIILPSGETDVLDVAFRTCRPLTIHFISAGGLDGAVVHWSGTESPTFASDGPDIDTCVGATVWAVFNTMEN